MVRPVVDTAVAVRGATLEVESLTVRFGGVVAVNDVSLRVEPGTVVGLIGPNGAGKTTLIDAVTGFVAVEPGSAVRVDGVDVTTWSPARRARAASPARSSRSSCSRTSASARTWRWRGAVVQLPLPARPRAPGPAEDAGGRLGGHP